MNEENNLAQNLKLYKELRKITTGELASELDISPATLKHIMDDGNTTLHTAIRISRNLGICLDMLIGDAAFSDKLFIMEHMKKADSWLSGFSTEKRMRLARLMSEMWMVLSSDNNDIYQDK